METDRILQKKVIDYLSKLADNKRKEIDSLQLTLDAIGYGDKSFNANAGYGSSQTDQGDKTTNKHRKNGKKVLKPVDSFNAKGKLDHKISYVLTKIHTGTKDDIMKELVKIQTEKDPHKVEQAVAVRLSYLLKNGFIEGEKSNRRYQYRLKAEEL